ncbi:MAG: hypothetical protein ACD_62C00031G0001, partial [uncultured bacterium]
MDERELKHALDYVYGTQPLAFVRELVQNGLDAAVRASSEELRKIDVKAFVNRESGHLVMSVRDYYGMSDEVIQKLILPFESDKQLDPDQLGEFGIGFNTAIA